MLVSHSNCSMNSNNMNYDNEDYFFESLEEYLQEARENPERLNNIVASAVMEHRFSVKAFVEEFDFDYNMEILDLDYGELQPVMSRALKDCDVDEIKYLLSLPGMEVPFIAYDLLFNGKGSYYTWLDEVSASERAPIISKVVDILGDKLKYMEIADWWHADFCNHVRCNCNGKHPYLEYENLRNILRVPEDEDEQEN